MAEAEIMNIANDRNRWMKIARRIDEEIRDNEKIYHDKLLKKERREKLEERKKRQQVEQELLEVKTELLMSQGYSYNEVCERCDITIEQLMEMIHKKSQIIRKVQSNIDHQK